MQEDILCERLRRVAHCPRAPGLRFGMVLHVLQRVHAPRNLHTYMPYVKMILLTITHMLYPGLEFESGQRKYAPLIITHTSK